MSALSLQLIIFGIICGVGFTYEMIKPMALKSMAFNKKYKEVENEYFRRKNGYYEFIGWVHHERDPHLYNELMKILPNPKKYYFPTPNQHVYDTVIISRSDLRIIPEDIIAELTLKGIL